MCPKKSALEPLLSLLSEVNEAAFVKDLDGRYRVINEAGARMLGRSIDQVIGRTDGELFEAASAQEVVERDQSVIRGGKPLRFQTVATASSGTTRRYLAIKAPCVSAAGEITGLIGVSRDVTAWEYKLSQASHEIKTPLTALSLQLELVHMYLGENAPERVRTLLNRARENTLRLEKTIDQSLSVLR